MATQHFFYGNVQDQGYWRAIVYHWDESGNRRVIDYKGSVLHDDANRAIDDACEWAEAHGIDATMD